MAERDNDTIKIATNLLAEIVQWARVDGNGPTRCVAFFRGDRIVATDGHRLVVVPHKTCEQGFLLERRLLVAAIAAQDAMARDGMEPKIDHDMTGDAILADGPHGDRTIGITYQPKRATSSALLALGDGGILWRVPVWDISTYPPIDQVFEQGARGISPDGYQLDARLLASIYGINNATAGYTSPVRVVSCGFPNEDGERPPLCLEGRSGVKFAIMPFRDTIIPPGGVNKPSRPRGRVGGTKVSR